MTESILLHTTQTKNISKGMRTLCCIHMTQTCILNSSIKQVIIILWYLEGQVVDFLYTEWHRPIYWHFPIFNDTIWNQMGKGCWKVMSFDWNDAVRQNGSLCIQNRKFFWTICKFLEVMGSTYADWYWVSEITVYLLVGKEAYVPLPSRETDITQKSQQ